MPETTISLVDQPDGVRSVIVHLATRDKDRAQVFFNALRYLFLDDKDVGFNDETKPQA